MDIMKDFDRHLKNVNNFSNLRPKKSEISKLKAKMSSNRCYVSLERVETRFETYKPTLMIAF